MNLGLGFAIVELERQEAVDRAMARYRAEKAREQRRRTTTRANTGLGRGARRITKAQAIELLKARGHIRGALRLANGGR
jgi:hypothetical protein